MSTAKTLQINSRDSDVTEHLGEVIGANLRGGEVIELVSDVGGGKTTFTRGLARGAGSTDRVSSPTFTVSKMYEAPKFTIFHYDFYRLNEPGIMAAELDETVHDKDVVTVIEWSDIVAGVLPEERLRIEFIQNGDESREVKMTIPGEIAYLMEGIQP